MIYQYVYGVYLVPQTYFIFFLLKTLILLLLAILKYSVNHFQPVILTCYRSSEVTLTHLLFCTWFPSPPHPPSFTPYPGFSNSSSIVNIQETNILVSISKLGTDCHVLGCYVILSESFLLLSSIAQRGATPFQTTCGTCEEDIKSRDLNVSGLFLILNGVRGNSIATSSGLKCSLLLIRPEN